MFPGMNPKAVEQAMKRLGVKQQDIPASEVIIKSEGRDIIISNPKVVRVNMMGQDSFQISGDVGEREAEIEVSDDDVLTVSGQAGVSEAEARAAIQKAGGDLAEAIIGLKK